MTGVVKMYFQAETLIEATQLATERWRQIVSDDEADLPWSTHILMKEDNGGGKLEVEVLVEFDRTLVDGVTSG
jgi:hypothetical protein